MDELTKKLHVLTAHTPICRLEVGEAFSGLTDKEKRYAHFLSRASWAGAHIVLRQISQEAPIIFDMLQHLFSEDPGALVQKAKDSPTIGEHNTEQILNYVATFYGNLSNYLSFGDTKFVPSVSVDTFSEFVKLSKNQRALQLFEQVKEKIFSLNPNELELGFPPDNTSEYYTPNVTKEDMDLVAQFMKEKDYEPWNTRLFKDDNGCLQLRISSAETFPMEEFDYHGTKIQIISGDHANELKQVVHYLNQALAYAANKNQENMIQDYIKHFSTGNITIHKSSQSHWIKDKGPAVETNIGFIENYRDPFGVRAEFESFVAIVNRVTSAKFGQLVTMAPNLLPLLPWSNEFEKPEFQKPDFTSLEVLTFTTSGLPAGINIPNYDSIRQNEGFKNVSLGNVLSATTPEEPTTFLSSSDDELFRKLKAPAFEIQVGLHELLGHGSGRLIYEGQFDKENLIHPFTGKPLHSCYKAGETYDSVFSTIGSSYEECRAECVGTFLSTNKTVLEIFGFEDTSVEEDVTDVSYVNWLSMARAGFIALEFYSPEQKKWRQSHAQARYSIMRTMLLAGKGLLQLKKAGDDDITICLDRKKIRSVGIPAVGDYLHKLNVYKATADFESASKLYGELTSVPQDFLKLREIVIAKKKPRRIFVQAHTEIVGDKVELLEFEASTLGMIKSFQLNCPLGCN